MKEAELLSDDLQAGFVNLSSDRIRKFIDGSKELKYLEKTLSGQNQRQR
jgi:hypothetical protein